MNRRTWSSVLTPAGVGLALQAVTCSVLAQQAPTSDTDASQCIALLESEVRRRRGEVARLRASATDVAPAWGALGAARLSPERPLRLGPGHHPPLSPLQAQVQWLAPPALVFVPPLDAVQCPRCLPCR